MPDPRQLDNVCGRPQFISPSSALVVATEDAPERITEAILDRFG